MNDKITQWIVERKPIEAPQGEIPVDAFMDALATENERLTRVKRSANALPVDTYLMVLCHSDGALREFSYGLPHRCARISSAFALSNPYSPRKIALVLWDGYGAVSGWRDIVEQAAVHFVEVIDGVSNANA